MLADEGRGLRKKPNEIPNRCIYGQVSSEERAAEDMSVGEGGST